ncbi:MULTISPECIES: hypothetical protein [Lysinibacillus]|uniref:hypothetical protein n=1 Tax=Lysinibacillus TaxID=400634 RepID=UPI0021A3A585|nr:hypothetical protein [Lysinibacillus capsici]MCT1540251.1 hypothetical protein [Lysinibacillus capsici]MCT1571320.1 hypothetical protein [Lysinibacillus capsici]MCT1647890.1 hypothetical protein [Lysinibacillus capsici]MCT1726432.1 hypothetical protein [Lysinibacillus capsici]MCT1783536.1 hypothetical protein [Lysinibacillus capsici]
MNRISLSLSHKEFCHHFVVFQGNYMRLEQLLNSFNNRLQEANENGLVEILPSIYFKYDINVKKGPIKERIRDRFLKIFKIEPSNFEVLQRTTYHLEFDIRNIRDYFRIADELSEDKIIEKRNLGDETINDELRYVHSDELVYPNTLGSGSGNCGIWDVFSKNGLFTTFDRDYSLFNLSTLLEITSYRPEYIDTICFMGNTCSKIIPLMRKQEFLPGTISGTDDIETEFDGKKYITFEGKHRTCAAKKLKLESVPILAYVPTTISKSTSNTYYKGLEKNCNDILENCYYLFEQMGLRKEEAKYLNEHITNDIYIEYIEEKTGKRFEEIKIKNNLPYLF